MTTSWRDTPASVDWLASPGDHVRTLTFTDSAGDPTDESGTWLCQVRASVSDATVSITVDVDTSGAVGGEIVLTLDEDELLALIESGASRWVGWWSIAKDGIEEMAGKFVLSQKGARS